ncbi:MAG TPA: 50S ribosomal protein L11 methyltransferase [Rhizomicrobium sp.]|jgi:ribosomal protein L11 methyltransferase|nr:50S ribosomal protein L11 methyltransferase [Rhizomicrobium sp.]
MNSAPLWKASVTLAKVRAGEAAALFELTPPRPEAVVVDEEPFGANATVEALYIGMPDGELLSRLIGNKVYVALLPDLDWIRLSQEGLPPVRAGRFFVYGAHDKGTVPHGVIPLRIEAGLAFGTGHHETTAMCLALISRLAKRRRFARILDLGCGTGLLAIGMARLSRQRILAADIDPVAVAVARENARDNGVGPLVRTLVADGLGNDALKRATPFDCIVANILAGPLTRLAPQIAAALAPRGVLILSGLLRWQENLVLGFYRPHRLVLREILRDGNWSALLLERVARPR